MKFWHSKRLVYARRTSQVAPRLSHREHERHQGSEAMRLQMAPHENFHGLEIGLNNNAVNDNMLGVREDLWRALDQRGRGAGLQIMDEAINERLREIAAREISIDKQNAGWLERRFIAGRGFFHDIRGLFSERHDEIGTRVETLFGAGETIDQRRVNVAQQVWTALTVPQRNAVSALLTANGVALPPPPPLPVGVNAQIMQLSLASPAVLRLVQRMTVVGGVPVFGNQPRARYYPGP
ncbi:MAG TPA: hypothetical protein VI588_03195, partial [Candidatus Gracilibacteria bacterium]|nr:hypothetical protein [Candidatus Gracilibacteria bacterium]